MKYNDKEVICDLPAGELYIFHTPAALKEFIATCGFYVDQLPFVGAKFVPTKDESEYEIYENVESLTINGETCSETSYDSYPVDKECYVVSIHDPNPFFERDGMIEPAYLAERGVVSVEDIQLDPVVWVEEKFPYVAYFCFRDTWDRIGNFEMQIVSCCPLDELHTTSSLKWKLGVNLDEKIKAGQEYMELTTLRDMRDDGI